MYGVRVNIKNSDNFTKPNTVPHVQMAPNNLDGTKQTLQLHDATAPLKIIFVFVCVFLLEQKVTFSSLRSHKIMCFAKFGRFLCTNLQLSYALFLHKQRERIIIVIIIARILLLLKLSRYSHRENIGLYMCISVCVRLVNQMVCYEYAGALGTEHEGFL